MTGWGRKPIPTEKERHLQRHSRERGLRLQTYAGRAADCHRAFRIVIRGNMTIEHQSEDQEQQTEEASQEQVEACVESSEFS